MNVIPKKDFIRKIIVNAIRTHCKHCGTYQKRLRQCILKIPKVRNIVQDVNGDKNYRMILLNENVFRGLLHILMPMQHRNALANLDNSVTYCLNASILN